MSIARRHRDRKAAGERFDFEAAAADRAESAAVAPEGASETEQTDPDASTPALVSPAKAKRLRHLAATLVAANDNTPAEPDAGPRGEGYRQVAIQLDADRRRLKGIQSLEDKIKVKRTMLPEYAPWVDSVLAADVAVQDDVVANIMIWRIDTEDFAGGLAIADWMLRHGIALPERFNRTPATLVAELVAEAALNAFKADKDFDKDALVTSLNLTATFDMPDEVRAKQHKAMGLLFFRHAAKPTEEMLQVAGFVQLARQAALANLRRASELNPRAGVVKQIEALERELKKDAE